MPALIRAAYAASAAVPSMRRGSGMRSSKRSTSCPSTRRFSSAERISTRQVRCALMWFQVGTAGSASYQPGDT